jgi:hypothetical protein
MKTKNRRTHCDLNHCYVKCQPAEIDWLVQQSKVLLLLSADDDIIVCRKCNVENLLKPYCNFIYKEKEISVTVIWLLIG